MQVILIVTVVLLSLVSGSAGASIWESKFSKGACNETACCCPSTDLVIDDKGAGSLNIAGLNCKGTNPLSIAITNLNSSTFTITDIATLNVNDTALTVVLMQDPATNPPCPVVMIRDTGSTGNPQATTAANSGAPPIHAPLLINLISGMTLLLSVIHV